MSRFYELFEQVTRDIYQGFIPLIRDRLSPDIRPELTNIELECRFKTASSEKFKGMIERVVRGRRDMGREPQITEVTDENYDSKPYTLRVSKTREYPPEEEKYLKMKIFPPRNSQLQKALGFFEEMGMKISLSLEIRDEKLFSERFQRLPRPLSPLVRVKSRTSYTHIPTNTSLDLTKVIENERFGLEIEADKTIPLTSFLSGDSQGMLKQFLTIVDILGREVVYQTRTPLPFPVLDAGLAKINEGLGFVKRDDRPTYKIQKMVPQVRNLQVTDLLKDNYKGYAVTPKADGYRFFMVILPQFIILVQPPNIYKVVYEGPGIPREWVGFVFDGELVGRQNWREENLTPEFLRKVGYYYCIFDVLGYPESGFPDVDRTDILRRINRLKTFFEEVRRSPLGALTWDKTLDLIYVHARETLRLPSLVTAIEIKPYDDGKHSPWAVASAFFDTLRPKLRYHDDGLIFTPLERSYRELNEDVSLKWKPEDLLSIDFQYRESGELFVMDGDKPVPFTGTQLFPIPGRKPEFSNLTEKLIDGGIYEFVYEPSTRKFRFTRPRPDKGMPNRLSDASQVWTDVHVPISSDLLRGVGSSGMRECMREGLWSWVSQLRSRPGLEKMSVIVDLSDIHPMSDFPIRVLEEGFLEMFREVKVYREDATRHRLDFPNLAPIPETMDSHIDVLILDGVQFSILEGRSLTYHPQPERATELVEKISRLLPHARYVFVRGLCSIERDEFFVPEMHHDQEEDLVIRMIEEKVLEIEYRPGGLFPYSLTKMVAYPRTLSKNFPCISSGHRLTADLSDNGPENILGNPRQGRLWDFLFNVLLPGDVVEDLIPKLSLPTPPNVLLIEQLLSKTTLEEKVPEPVVEQMTEARLRTLLGTAEVERKVLEPITFEAVTFTRPEIGDIFTIISKVVYGLRGSAQYDPRTVEISSTELRALLPPTLDTERIVEEIFLKLGLSMIFLRRITPGLSLSSFRTAFLKPELGAPRFGYILLESLNSELDLTKSCRLISYQGSTLIHPSDPLIPILFSQPLRTIHLEKSSALSPGRLRVKAKIFGEEKNWPSLHRLFMISPYLQVSDRDSSYGAVREFVEQVREESTDNKAMYLVSQKIPKRFEKQTWAKELQGKIDRAVSRGVAPVKYETNVEEHVRNFLRSMTITDKAKKEIAETGDAFLFDETLPGNIYGIAYMTIRSTL